MKSLLLWTLLLMTSLLPEAWSQGVARFYTGTFTSEGAEGISLCTLDTLTGDMEVVQVFKGIDNPNFLKISPDRRFLYAVTRGPRGVDPDGGSVSAFQIMDNGELRFLNKMSAHGDDPCYAEVSSDGRWLVVANYGGGSVVLFPLEEDGSLAPATSVVRHEGSGAHAVRQTRPYAHSIRFSPFDGLLYAADLGADRLFAYTLRPGPGTLEPKPGAQALLPPGAGPRHFDFAPEGRFCYVVNEISSTVSVFEFVNGAMSLLQDISTLPGEFRGTSFCADIHLSSCGKWLYASNRGHNSLAVFSRDAVTGRLTPVTHVSVEGNWPRNFALAPGGRYLLVANQRSHQISLFRLENGIPLFTGKELKTPAPVCVEFL